MDKIVAVFASRQCFYIRSDSAGQIDEAVFKCRTVVGPMALHNLSSVQTAFAGDDATAPTLGLVWRRGHLEGTSLVRPAAFSWNPITSGLAALVSFAHFSKINSLESDPDPLFFPPQDAATPFEWIAWDRKREAVGDEREESLLRTIISMA